MEFNNLRYETDMASLENTRILYDQPQPDRLVKFYNPSKFSYHALMGRYLYLTYTSQFNDLFEANEYLMDFSRLDRESYDDWYRRNLPPERYLDYDIDRANNFSMFRKIYLSILAWIGSISFTTEENENNALMWSHYSSDKGFLIELDRNLLIESIEEHGHWLFPINYVESLLPINPIDKRYGGVFGALLYVISTKSNDWGYENEWRLTCYNRVKGDRFFVPETMFNPFTDGEPRELHYSVESVKKIILGSKFFNPDIINADRYRNSDEMLTYEIKDEYIDFVNFLFDNYNHILHMCGPVQEEGGEISRRHQRIELKHVSVNTFTLIPIRE